MDFSLIENIIDVDYSPTSDTFTNFFLWNSFTVELVCSCCETEILEL